MPCFYTIFSDILLENTIEICGRGQGGEGYTQNARRDKLHGSERATVMVCERERKRETRGRAETGNETGMTRSKGRELRRGAPTALNAPRRRRPLSRCLDPLRLGPRGGALLYGDVNKAWTVAPKRYVHTYIITRSPLFFAFGNLADKWTSLALIVLMCACVCVSFWKYKEFYQK